MTDACWVTAGDPLVRGSGAGPLTGLTVAVKDVYAVAGHPTGAGVPQRRAEAEPAPRHAAAVQVLLDAGADVAGIAVTDQLAYSIAGTNEHFAVPANPAVPGGVPGGSSSGSASAVAQGRVDVGLGTDTAGSIRVPASYQGLWGLRPTYGVASLDGCVPLAPSFDTVGWLTRDAVTLRRVLAVTLPEPSVPTGAVVAPAVTGLLDPAVAAAFAERLDVAGLPAVDLPDLDRCVEAFRVVQAGEAWDAHGSWITDHPDALRGAVRARFAVAAAIGADERAAARRELATYRDAIDAALGDRVLLLPSAPSAAPRLDADPASVDHVRARTLRLTCLAGTTGRPALSVPLLGTADGPVGLCLVGPPGSDRALVDLAASAVRAASVSGRFRLR